MNKTLKDKKIKTKLRLISYNADLLLRNYNLGKFSMPKRIKYIEDYLLEIKDLIKRPKERNKLIKPHDITKEINNKFFKLCCKNKKSKKYNYTVSEGKVIKFT